MPGIFSRLNFNYILLGVYIMTNFIFDAINNTSTTKLYYMPYAQAHWDVTAWYDGTETWGMTSYSSRIFTAGKEGGRVYRISTEHAQAAINYSRTTSRQVTAAMQELSLSGGEIAALKRFFTRGGKVAVTGCDSWLNAETGEVIWEGVRV